MRSRRAGDSCARERRRTTIENEHMLCDVRAPLRRHIGCATLLDGERLATLKWRDGVGN